jgi:hypothetical protein
MGSMTADQIYQNFHTQAKGTAGLESAQQIAQELADWYPDSAVSVQKLVDGIQSGWQGDAAEAASQGLTPLAENSLTTGQQLGTAQDLISRQVGSFHTAAAEVQQVPPEPSVVDAIGSALLGQPPVGALVQMEQHHAVQQANVDAYQKYVSASQYNTSNLPTLADSVASPTAPVSVTVPAAATAPGATGSVRAPRLPSSSVHASSASTRSTATTGTSKSGRPAVLLPRSRRPLPAKPHPSEQPADPRRALANRHGRPKTRSRSAAVACRRSVAVPRTKDGQQQPSGLADSAAAMRASLAARGSAAGSEQGAAPHRWRVRLPGHGQVLAARARVLAVGPPLPRKPLQLSEPQPHPVRHQLRPVRWRAVAAAGATATVSTSGSTS